MFDGTKQKWFLSVQGKIPQICAANKVSRVFQTFSEMCPNWELCF